MLDWMPLINTLTEIAAPIIGLLLLFAAGKYLGIRTSEGDRAALDGMIKRGLALGVSKLAGPDGKVETKNLEGVAGIALEYLAQTSPALVKRVAGGPSEALKQRLLAQLAQQEAEKGA